MDSILLHGIFLSNLNVETLSSINGKLQTDVLSLIPGTGETNIGKAVDSVAGGTDTGIAMLAVRADAPSV